MGKLWRERTDYKQLDGQISVYSDIRDYLPYKRLYEDLNQYQLQALLEDAKRLHWQALDLHSCKLNVIPTELGDLSDLKALDLFGNTKISVLPNSFRNLTNLQRLSLAETRISVLPDCIANLKNLKALFLYGTFISALPDFIGNLTKLQTLDLSATRIESLPDSIKNLKNLQTLNLDGTLLNEKLSLELRKQPAQTRIFYILDMQTENKYGATLPILPLRPTIPVVLPLFAEKLIRRLPVVQKPVKHPNSMWKLLLLRILIAIVPIVTYLLLKLLF